MLSTSTPLGLQEQLWRWRDSFDINEAVVVLIRMENCRDCLLDASSNELEFRFGNRNNPYKFRYTIKRSVSAGVLPFAKLTEDG